MRWARSFAVQRWWFSSLPLPEAHTLGSGCAALHLPLRPCCASTARNCGESEPLGTFC